MQPRMPTPAGWTGYFSKPGSAMTRPRMIPLSPGLKATEIVSVCALYACLGVLLLAGTALCAQQTPESLEKLARNPVGDSIKIPVAESINFDAGPYARTSNSLQIQPTIPFPIAKEWLLIPRIVAPLTDYEPQVSQASGGNTGLGDTVATLFLTPAHTGMVAWGAGPSLLIPTATETNTGAGKWGLGPSLAFILQPNWGSIATAVQNIWSFAGNSQRTPVNQLQIETSLSYNFPRGWYLLTAPTFSADWTQSRGERWLAPFGGGIGRTVEIARKGVDWNIALYSNAIRPEGQLYPKWQMSLQWTLLYPRGG
jgi:Putative MetA-pathway of phenol degradation